MLRRVRNHSWQNLVRDVPDQLIYGLEFLQARGASGNNDSGRSGSVWECPQSMLLNLPLKVREKFFPLHSSSEEERDE